MGAQSPVPLQAEPLLQGGGRGVAARDLSCPGYCECHFWEEPRAWPHGQFRPLVGKAQVLQRLGCAELGVPCTFSSLSFCGRVGPEREGAPADAAAPRGGGQPEACPQLCPCPRGIRCRGQSKS